MSRVLELFGAPTGGPRDAWKEIVARRWCPFLDRLCLKNRKSRPDILIGTCSVVYGKGADGIVICPHRLLERKQIFTDCIQLLTLHEPGNEFHVVPEISIPGGSVDYFLASVKSGKVRDFVGIELQTLDTTGTVWPERQRFLQEVGLPVDEKDVKSASGFGMNWKMTAKTTLVQLHHKVDTFENLNKHLVLVVQDHLITYMKKNFSFGHIREARLGDAMHFHAYQLTLEKRHWRLELSSRLSTDAAGIAKCMGMQASARVDLDLIVSMIEAKISHKTLLSFGPPVDEAHRPEPS